MRPPEGEQRQKGTEEMFKTVRKISQRSTNGVEQLNIYIGKKLI